MKEIKPITPNYDEIALKLFTKSIEVVGGPRKLIQHRALTWLPSLMTACYVITLKEEAKQTNSQIAQTLGISRQTVRNILEADINAVKIRLEKGSLAQETKKLKYHIAGGIAKLAWQKLREN